MLCEARWAVLEPGGTTVKPEGSGPALTGQLSRDRAAVLEPGGTTVKPAGSGPALTGQLSRDRAAGAGRGFS